MPQSKKISPQSSFVRFMVGSIMTAYGTARLMRNPRSRMAQGLVVLGAMQAAEGATGYCPTKGMMSNVIQNGRMSNLTQSASNMAQRMTGNGNPVKQAANAVQNAVPGVGQLMNTLSNGTGGTAAGTNASNQSQSGYGTNAGTNQKNAGTSFKDGAPSDEMMKDVADKVISAATKNTHAAQITQ